MLFLAFSLVSRGFATQPRFCMKVWICKWRLKLAGVAEWGTLSHHHHLVGIIRKCCWTDGSIYHGPQPNTTM